MTYFTLIPSKYSHEIEIKMHKSHRASSVSILYKCLSAKCAKRLSLALFFEEFQCYSKIFQVYYTLAYHLGCIPYKFQKRRDGRYILHEWWFQKVLCYLISALHIYLILFRFEERLVSLMRETKRDNDNPFLYLRLIEASVYANLALTVNYIQSANKMKILKFQNNLRNYSEKYHPSSRNLSQARKLLCSSNFLKLVGLCVTMISLFNTLIVSNAQIEFIETLCYAQETFLWKPIESTNKSSVAINVQPNFRNNILVSFYTITQAIRGMKDMFAEGFFIVGIIPLWLVSLDFSGFIRKEKLILCWKSNMRKNNAFGYALLCYLVNYFLYISTKIDTIFLPGTSGAKFYEIEYLCTFGLIYGLGASFAYQMKSLQRFTNLQSVSNRLKHNNCALVSFLYSRNFCAIKAKSLTVNFTTLTEFISQVMVIFLICVQSKLQREPL